MVLPVKKPVWIVLGSALLFHILILSLQANHHPGPGFARVWLIDALVPLEKVANNGIDGVWGIWDGYIALVRVRDENRNLKAENDRLRMETARLAEAGHEAERLRALVHLSESGVGGTVAARVIGRDPSRSQQTVTIDRGQSQNVSLNDAVISPDGVVGRVISAGKFSAVVQLLNDAQSAIGVLVERSRVQAVFKGSGEHDIELDYIDDDNGIQEGDGLLTSGLDGLYPKGLPVATVTSVGPRRGLFKAIRARLRAEVARLEEVLVVTEPTAPPPPQTTDATALPSD